MRQTAAPTVVLVATAREAAAIAPALASLRAPAPLVRITGAGKVGAAIEATRVAAELRPERLLQIGCAGAFPGSGLAIGDVVLATEEVLADEGAETPGGFIDLESLGLPSAAGPAGAVVHNRVPVGAWDGAAGAELARAFAGRFRVISGRLITVSTVSGSARLAAAHEERWRPAAESMEGAAAALAAWRAGLPFHEIRGISNLVGPRDRGSWDIESACRHAAEVAVRWLDFQRPSR